MKTKSFLFVAVMALGGLLPAARSAVFTNNSVIGQSDLTYENEALVVNNCTLTVNGPHSFASLAVTGNGVVMHSPAPGGEADRGVNLTIETDLTIELGSRIDVTGLGYGAQAGPGQGTPAFYGGGGGGYGGEGGGPGGSSYGSINAPVDFGSGGGNGGYGPGGAGGGVVQLTVGGTLTVDGQILADGQNMSVGYGAGGSGGSVYLTAGTLSGSGAIRAKGGDGANGGAGGRIALDYKANSFSGAITTFGGAGSIRGGAGTVFEKAVGVSAGFVRVDNGGLQGAQTPLTSPVPFHLTISNFGILRPSAPLTNLESLVVASNGFVSYPAAQPGFKLVVQGDATVEEGGAIFASCELSVHGNLLISAGGVISASGKGHGTDAGPGQGHSDYYHASGGGYGGLGGRGAGANGGLVYGSLLQPMDLGSGGGSDGVCGNGCPGGAGGGAIRLDVDGRLTVDGQLTADGLGGAAGGSGGSLFLSASTLTGSGLVSAAGGATGDAYAGGGGGGRIALYYNESSFLGTVSAVGGSGGAQSGGPGSIYSKLATQEFGVLLVDGTGRTNAVETPITSPTPFSLVISNATVYPDGALLVGGLAVTTNATITHLAGGPPIRINVLGDAAIDEGAGIILDGRGFPSAQGPGHGNASYYYGSGAGHGGPGGDSTDVVGGLLTGGSPYGSETMPLDLGSGGGSAFICGPCPGGAGGGAIELTVGGTLTLNGHLTANGTDGSGGGSGGSIFLTVGQLGGTGLIAANGGATGPWQGGGSGGRIAIYSSLGRFYGTVSATGGSSGAGGNSGGTGTIFQAAVLPPIYFSAIGLTSARLTWYGFDGVSYQPQASATLSNWADQGSPSIGTNGPISFTVPITSTPALFFRIRAGN